jgi:serine/threonine-protein kinase
LPALPVRLEVETDKPHILTARRKGYELFEEEITFEDGQAQKTIEITLTERPTEEPERRRRSMPRASRPSPSPAPSSERNPASEKADTAAPQPARRATLTLTSTPPANVVLDGKPLGATPRTNITVEPGTHRVIFIHGASRKIETVEATPGSNQTVSVNF